VPLVDLLAREPAALLQQVDEPEVARPEHHHVPVGDVVLRELPLLRAACRLPERVAHACVVLVSVGDRGHIGTPVERARDELVQPVAVPLLEGRALRLP